MFLCIGVSLKMAIYRRNVLEGSSLRTIYNFIGVFKGLQTQCRE
jgi:hypothetical protein